VENKTVFQRNGLVSAPNILARKSEEGLLPYYITGAKSEGNNPLGPLVNGIVAKKDVLFTRIGDVSLNVKRSRVGKYYKVEGKLLVWFKQMAVVGVPIDVIGICAKAVEIADWLKVEFNLSNGWINRFRKRTGLVLRTVSGESHSVNLTEAEVWKTKHLPHLLEGYRPCDAFNADKYGLFYNLLPSRTYAFRREKCRRGKLRKDRITVIVAANMDSSEKLPLLVIGRSEKTRIFENIKLFQNGLDDLHSEEFLRH
jgi:hypothetical protein